jgi:hypothetical protein
MTGLVATIDLNPGKYQSSLNVFRDLIESRSLGDIPVPVGLKTPKAELVELGIRPSDLYVVGFVGLAGRRYSFNDQTGPGWAGEPCGVGSNYHDLGHIGNVSYEDLKNLGDIANFAKGRPLERRLIAIAIGISSEAARLATVATYFTGLTNSVGTEYSQWLPKSVDFEHLKMAYFRHWAKPPDSYFGKLEPGKLYHFGSGEILIPHPTSHKK